MEFKIPKKRIIIKVTSVLIISTVLLYLLSALMLINNRITYSLEGTTWISKDRGKLSFQQEVGKFTTSEKTLHFAYSQKRGYVVCKNNNKVVFELLGLSDNRLFSVTTNTIFYDAAFLS